MSAKTNSSRFALIGSALSSSTSAEKTSSQKKLETEYKRWEQEVLTYPLYELLEWFDPLNKKKIQIPDWQRSYHAWEPSKRTSLIDTAIKGGTINPIYIQEIKRRGRGLSVVWNVIDGQHRLRTFWDFIQSDESFRLVDGGLSEDLIPYLKNKSISSIPEDLAERLKNFKVNIVVLRNMSQLECSDYFERLNQGVTKLSKAQILKGALYGKAMGLSLSLRDAFAGPESKTSIFNGLPGFEPIVNRGKLENTKDEAELFVFQYLVAEIISRYLNETEEHSANINLILEKTSSKRMIARISEVFSYFHQIEDTKLVGAIIENTEEILQEVLNEVHKHKILTPSSGNYSKPTHVAVSGILAVLDYNDGNGATADEMRKLRTDLWEWAALTKSTAEGPWGEMRMAQSPRNLEASAKYLLGLLTEEEIFGN